MGDDRLTSQEAGITQRMQMRAPRVLRVRQDGPLRPVTAGAAAATLPSCEENVNTAACRHNSEAVRAPGAVRVRVGRPVTAGTSVR